MDNAGVGQRAKPKSSVSKASDASGEEDNNTTNNWYGKLKGMSNSLKKLAQPKKRFPVEGQGGQGLERVLSFNSSKSVDHGSSSSRKDLAATNLKGLGYNSVDLSCGISRGLNITPTGGLHRRRNKSLELPRDVSKVDVTPFFSKSKIPIVKSNFVKETKEDAGDSRVGGHEYQRLALGSDSDDEPGAYDHPTSTSLEYESSLANLMLMGKLGSGPERQSPAGDAAVTQEDMEGQLAGDRDGTLPSNTAPANPPAPAKRLDVIISGPGAAGGGKEAGGSGLKPAKTFSTGGTSGSTGWPLRRLAGVGSGPLLSNGRIKGAGGDKKVNSVAVETANAGIRGKGAPFGRKNMKSMSGELFILKSSKKSGADPVVPARKSVSDLPSRKSLSKDSAARKQQVEPVGPLSGTRLSPGILSDLGPRKPAGRVTSKKPAAGEAPARKSVDLGREGPRKPFAQQKNGRDLSSELVLSNGPELSAATALTRQGNDRIPGGFPKAIHHSAPAAQVIHPHLLDDPGASTHSSGGAGSADDGHVKRKEEGAYSQGKATDGRSELSDSGVMDANGRGSLIKVAHSSSDTRKSVQDLIRELERNAAQSNLTGSGKSKKGLIGTPKSKEQLPAEASREGAGSESCRTVNDSSQQAPADDDIEVTTDGIPTLTASSSNDVSLTIFNSASVTTEQQNGVLRAELSESFEELHHKLKIDLDPRVVQDIHRTFNLGLVQAVAAASAGDSGGAASSNRSKPSAEMAAAAPAGPDRFGAKKLLGDGNRRKKLVAPPRALGAAYTNTIIGGLAGPTGTTTKPSAAAGQAATDLAIVEVGTSSVELSSSSENPIREIVPTGFSMMYAGGNDQGSSDNSHETPVEADAGTVGRGESTNDHLPEPESTLDLVGVQSSSVESPEVRILSSTSSNKMLTTENFHRVAARLAGRTERASPHQAEVAHHGVASEPVDIPRSSMESVGRTSSTSSNRMLSAKNFHRVAALLNEYNAEMKSGLVSQPRPAGGLDSSSSSFNRLEPMLDDLSLEMTQTAESASEADRSITKEIVPDSAYSRMAQRLYAINTPASSSKSNDSSSPQRRGRGAAASRYRNIDYSAKVQSKLGQHKDRRGGAMSAESGSNPPTSTARRSLDLQLKSQLSDPYYRKPKQSKYEVPLSSSSSSAQADRNHSKRGRARSPSVNAMSRDRTREGGGSDPDPDSQAEPAIMSSKTVSSGRSRTARRHDVDSPKGVTGNDGTMFRAKHHLSRPEYIDETNDSGSVWIDNGRTLEELEGSSVRLSSAAKRLQNSGLRPHDNLSYNGDGRTRKARRRPVRPNFSGPLVRTRREEEGLPSDDEDRASASEWPKSGPIIPASVLREIYDDRDISDDQDLVVDRTTFSAGVMKRGRDKAAPVPGLHSRSGALHFSGPLVSQTIRNSKVVHSGPPSSVSDNLFDRVSKMGRFSRSASAKLRETEGMDVRLESDGEFHESYDEHQHEYLIQDHDQLYEYLDQYSDRHTFLDQYIADQLHELSLQQDLHEILSDQLEKVQASAAAAAAEAGHSDLSLDSRADVVDMPFDEEKLPGRDDAGDEADVDGGRQDDADPRAYDTDAHAQGVDDTDIDQEEHDIRSEYSTEQPQEAKVLDSGTTHGLDSGQRTKYLVLNGSLEAKNVATSKDDHLAVEDLELLQEEGAKESSTSSYQHAPSSTNQMSDGWPPPRNSNVPSAAAHEAGALSLGHYTRSSSSKSLAASISDLHQDNLHRSTVSSRAKSKQYKAEESAIARSGSGYESDRNAGDQDGRLRFRGNHDFMNTSIQSEPGGIRGLLTTRRGTNSAHSSPATRGSSPSGSTGGSRRGRNGSGSEDRYFLGPCSSRSGRNPSALAAVTGKSSLESPRASSPTSFPSLYLMQVSSSSAAAHQPGSGPSRTSGSTLNRHLRPPSRNLLTQNIATISIEDFKSDRRSNPSAQRGGPLSSGPAAPAGYRHTSRAKSNSSLVKGPPSSFGSQKSSPRRQNESDFLNSSIQSEPVTHARTLLLNLEYQSNLCRGVSTSLNPEQMTRAADRSPHPQEEQRQQLQHPPGRVPFGSGNVNLPGGHAQEAPASSTSTDTASASADDEDSLLDDPSDNRDNEDEESEGLGAIQARNPPPAFPGASSGGGPAEEEGDDDDDDDKDSLEAITVASTMSVGAFRREALRKFGANRKREAVESSSQDLRSNFDARSTGLLSEQSYNKQQAGGTGGSPPETVLAAEQLTVAQKRSDLEKLCEAVDPCRDFQDAIVDMILDKDDINDLVDLEEFLNCYLCLRQPYQDVVRQFFGELCDATFVY